MNNTSPSRKVSPITEVLGTWLRKLLLREETPQIGAFQAGQNNTHNACESRCVKMTEWMNEAIMPMMLYSELCVVAQESQSFSARPPPTPPLVTVALWALLTLVELTLSHSGGAAPRFRVESHYFPSSLESSLTEIANPDCRRPRFPKTSPSLRTPLFLYKSARAFEYWWFFLISCRLAECQAFTGNWELGRLIC